MGKNSLRCWKRLPKNIQELIGTQEYTRIRIGIGNDFSHGGQIDFVLGEITGDQEKIIPEICDKVIEGVKSFSTIGVDRTMNSFNTK